MRIIRIDHRTGRREQVAGYEDVTIGEARQFLYGFANKEASRSGCVVVTSAAWRHGRTVWYATLLADKAEVPGIAYALDTRPYQLRLREPKPVKPRKRNLRCWSLASFGFSEIAQRLVANHWDKEERVTGHLVVDSREVIAVFEAWLGLVPLDSMMASSPLSLVEEVGSVRQAIGVLRKLGNAELIDVWN